MRRSSPLQWATRINSRGRGDFPAVRSSAASRPLLTGVEIVHQHRRALFQGLFQFKRSTPPWRKGPSAPWARHTRSSPQANAPSATTGGSRTVQNQISGPSIRRQRAVSGKTAWAERIGQNVQTISPVRTALAAIRTVSTSTCTPGPRTGSSLRCGGIPYNKGQVETEILCPGAAR